MVGNVHRRARSNAVKLLALALALAIAVGVNSSAQAAGYVPTTQELNAATKLFDKINAGRASPLVLRVFIRDEVEDHSQYMALQGAISHDGFCDNIPPDSFCSTQNNDESSRLERIWHSDAGIQNNHVCENVAYVRGVTRVGQAVNRLYNLWYNSTPHYNCMFDVGYAHTVGAVGIKKKGRRTWYATFIAANDTTAPL